MCDEDLRVAVDGVKEILEPLLQGVAPQELYKVSVYVEGIWKAFLSGGRDPEVLAERALPAIRNSLLFARRNLEMALNKALECLVMRPRSSSRADEERRARALKSTLDRLADPSSAMLEHYRTSSDPLSKYLVAGAWGHQYLLSRGIDLEDFDQGLCQALGCGDSPEGRLVLSYSRLCRALDAVEEAAERALAGDRS
ncbi:MAG: hypothetical protein QUS08_04280 [Methanothrix sp.]|nr:hypothetical protein [Methanothrix sp.]